MKTPILSGSFTVPKLKAFALWAGLYGGHYDVIAFFRRKPTHFDRGDPGEPDTVDMLAESDAGNVFANMGTGDFQAWFPDLFAQLGPPLIQDNGRPNGIEICKADLFRVRLSVPVDKAGNRLPLDFDVDGWTK